MAKTKQNEIALTLRNELEVRNFSEITVSEICDKCNCSRQTFYYYFTSLTDCLVYYLIEENFASINDKSKYQQYDYREACSGFFKYIYENKNFIIHIFERSSETFKILDFFFKTVKSALIKVLEHNNPDSSKLLAEDKEYIISFFTAAWSFSFIEWIKSDFKTTPEQETEKLFMVAEGMLVNASNRFIEYRKKNNK